MESSSMAAGAGLGAGGAAATLLAPGLGPEPNAGVGNDDEIQPNMYGANSPRKSSKGGTSKKQKSMAWKVVKRLKQPYYDIHPEHVPTASSTAPNLTRQGLIKWVRAEYKIFLLFCHYFFGDNFDYARGNPFAQGINDHCTLASHQKNLAIAEDDGDGEVCYL